MKKHFLTPVTLFLAAALVLPVMATGAGGSSAHRTTLLIALCLLILITAASFVLSMALTKTLNRARRNRRRKINKSFQTLVYCAYAATVIVFAVTVFCTVRYFSINTDSNASLQNTESTGSAAQTEEASGPSATQMMPDVPSEPPTQPPTQPPTEPPTEPPVPKPPKGMYTRAQLEAMENEGQGYGPGKTKDGKRAPYAVDAQNTYGKYGGNFIGPDDNTIYLTFDCGYEYNDICGRILDTLKEKNVKATFFITMDFAVNESEYVNRMINEGHIVGNHSHHHPVMTKLSIDKMEAEVMDLHNYVKEHYNYEMTLFRPPTGMFSTRSLAVVQNLGYKNVHWSYAHGDWDPENQPDVEKTYEDITRSAHNGAIYLLHAISDTNATVLPRIIDYFRANGYNLKSFQ